MYSDQQSSTIHSKGWLILLGAGLVAWVVWIVLPNTVVVFNDDFGYLRSVVAMLQHGRPWTDDWLEPWAASLSLVSGLIYKSTGSFLLATQGLQAAMAGLSFWAMVLLFARRAIPTVAAMFTAAVILFVPTLMVKWLEYTTLIIYVPCLLWAIHLAEKQRWAWFFVVWAVAVTSRQSALAWLALPGFAALSSLRPSLGVPRSRIIGPVAVCLAGLIVYLSMGRLMNETHAQRVMTTAMWHSLSVGPIAKHFAIGVAVFLLSVGGAAFALRVFCWRQDGQKPVCRGWWRGVRIAVAAVLLCLFCLAPRTLVAFEHPFYAEIAGRVFLGVLFGLGAVGWLLGDFRVQFGHIVCAMGSALIVSLRGAVYDYYLIDVAIMGLFSVLPAEVSSEQVLRSGRRIWPIFAVIGATTCVTLAGFEFVFVAKEQRILDRYAAVIRLCEPVLREGRVEPEELSVGPFGYYAWHLYPYFIRHDGAKGAYIGDFENYLKRDSLAVTFTHCSADQQKNEALVRDARGQNGVLECGVFEIGWRGSFLFVLRRTGLPSEAARNIDLSEYRQEPFPLSDAEWRQLIDGGKLQ